MATKRNSGRDDYPVWAVLARAWGFTEAHGRTHRRVGSQLWPDGTLGKLLDHHLGLRVGLLLGTGSTQDAPESVLNALGPRQRGYSTSGTSEGSPPPSLPPSAPVNVTPLARTGVAPVWWRVNGFRSRQTWATG